MLYLINIIFERTESTKFDNIEQFIKHFDSNHIVKLEGDSKEDSQEDSEEDTRTSIQNIKIDNIVAMVLSEVHGSFDIIKINSKHIPSLFNDLYSIKNIKNIKSFDELDNKSKLLLYSGLHNNDSDETLLFIYFDEYYTGYRGIKITKETFFTIFDNTPIDIINELQSGETSLLAKVLYNKLEDVAIKLIDRGAIFRSEQEDNLIDWVIYGRLKNLFEKIIDKININEPNKTGITPLISAILTYKPANSFNEINDDMTMTLIEKGADINAVDRDGKTPLIYAISYKKYNIAIKLIEKGADMNAKDKNGLSALMHAYKTKTDSLRNSRTPEIIAEEQKLDEIIEILKKSEAQIGGIKRNSHVGLLGLTHSIKRNSPVGLLGLTHSIKRNSKDYYHKYIKYKQKYINLSMM